MTTKRANPNSSELGPTDLRVMELEERIETWYPDKREFVLWDPRDFDDIGIRWIVSPIPWAANRGEILATAYEDPNQEVGK